MCGSLGGLWAVRLFSVVIGEVKRNRKEELNGKVSKRSVASLMEELILGAT